MSPKTPSINGQQLVRVLQKMGFVIKRQKGPSNRNFKSDLKDAEISSEELNELL